MAIHRRKRRVWEMRDGEFKPELTRRGFIAAGGALAAYASHGGAKAADTENQPAEADPFLGTRGLPLEVGSPCLQAPGETTMGVSWAVSGLSKGVVEYADNPDMRDAKTVKSGGFGLVPIDVSALQVRLTGLKPATKYWYRTVTTPFTDYANIYDAKLGDPIVSAVHSFTTLGVDAKAHFCMICDTHVQFKPFQMIVQKVKELAPSAVVWNGDATNTTQDKKTAVKAKAKKTAAEVEAKPAEAAKDNAPKGNQEPEKKTVKKPSANKTAEADKGISAPEKRASEDKKAPKKNKKKELPDSGKPEAETPETAQPVLEASEELLALMPAGCASEVVRPRELRTVQEGAGEMARGAVRAARDRLGKVQGRVLPHSAVCRSRIRRLSARRRKDRSARLRILVPRVCRTLGADTGKGRGQACRMRT